jgi:uncharacterized protein (DUF2062 family)
MSRIYIWLGGIGTLLVSAAIGWAAGYDFDYRGPVIAAWIFCSVILALLVAAVVYIFQLNSRKEDRQ